MCGLAGIIQPEGKFDYQTFTTLGCINDIRGGDSCGIYIDGKKDFGIEENKMFHDFYRKSPLLASVEQSTIALLHCRKSSVGFADANAQPVILTYQDTPEFVMIHNGTINNYRELAKKYIPTVDITGLSDSYVMAFIFYYTGYDVLKEYEGGGVLITHYPRTQTTLFFKGKSLNTANQLAEERPMNYVITGNELVFSSIGYILQSLRHESKPHSLPPNVLWQWNVGDKDFTKLAEYDRSTMKQSWAYTYPTYGQGYYGKYYK
jgi:asparagine synthetase B (glutamine-hydrolysing)